MSSSPAPDHRGGRSWTVSWVVLAILGLSTLALLLATPHLIKPFPGAVPWYESAAMFPRAALCVVILGACVELYLRRTNSNTGESDELDSSSASLPRALAICGLFTAYCVLVPILGYLSSSFVFLLAGGRVAGLSSKVSLILALLMALAMWAIFQIGLKLSFGHGWLI